MTTRLPIQTLRACVLLSVWLCALGVYFSGTAHGAEREICDKMTGEQLRRCIEDASRAQSAPATTGAPARASTSNASGAIILPPPPGKAAASTGPMNLGILNCTKVSYVDQSFCAFRNSALLECANRAKHPDPNSCLNDAMSRAPDLSTVDCSKLPDAHKTSCNQRNKVYALCKNDKMSYFACLETKMAKK